MTESNVEDGINEVQVDVSESSSDLETTSSREMETAISASGVPQFVRKKFAAVDDVILLRVVNAFRPWRAPVGTANGIMKAFDNIAVHCAKHKTFGVQKDGPALRTRFTTLVTQFKADQCKSLRQSGTSEEFQEREMLLQQIITQMDDWSDRVAAEKKQKGAKTLAIEKSGDDLKRLAMDELQDEDDDDDDDQDEESSATDASSTTQRAKSKSKRGRSKVTKTDRLQVVTDALASAITSTDKDAKEGTEWQQQKMAFKREEAKLQRQYLREEAALRREHEASEAARRREHELALEERRLKAENDRMKFMHEFMLRYAAQNSKPMGN